MSLKKDTESLIKIVFEEAHGYSPTKIRSMADEPVSEDNLYLYNPLFNQYEGMCRGKSGIDYLFFISGDEQGEWEYSFTPLPKK